MTNASPTEGQSVKVPTPLTGMPRGSYFDKPMTPHAAWASSLNPGTVVLTDWSLDIAEYASEDPFSSSRRYWQKTVIVSTRLCPKGCFSGVLVKIHFPEDCPELSVELDSTWIKPIEKGEEDEPNHTKNS